MRVVDVYFRWTLHCIPWMPAFLMLFGVVPLAGLTGRPLAIALAGVAAGLSLAQGGLAAPLLNRALDRYLNRGATPRALLLASGLITLLNGAALFALLFVGGIGQEDQATVLMATAAAITPVYKAQCLVVSKRQFLGALAGTAAGTGVLLFVLTGSWLGALGMAAMVAFAGLWSFVIARPTGWLLSVFWKLDAARTTASRLAVAEERLRFGRDLHDVMGRNLAVIALKSELAVQLARRERPEAVAQMTEVQRIAQESQREIREVVRGYRKADLQAELAGARSILRAAGVDCRFEGEEGVPLSAEVESALGWVVREGTTNVLRHAADVRTCALRTRIDPERSVLVMTMENDGVGGTEAGEEGTAAGTAAGSGLKGLRERLQPLGGTLASGPVRKGSYRLTVELPMTTAGVTG
ncbi:two-component histidine kinase [Streptomyces sp. NBRC 110611]|uniref:sensor histidine kinase n=1 Tax=Streptomyces sp. NBRC 110611 TaxID=1621259 RepID=UPI00085512F1|nr:histidine kinase [Streptomyces sp. NBRC 110611]GAU66402.1 two-component histidine kinase [Streptomyces sp. NBRC 110611]